MDRQTYHLTGEKLDKVMERYQRGYQKLLIEG